LNKYLKKILKIKNLLIGSSLNIKTNYNKYFYSILFLGLLARIYAAFFSGLGWYGYDTQLYLDMAKGIIDGNPVSFFPNGLPLLLAGIMLFSGSSTAIIFVLLNIVMQIAVIIMMEKILARYDIGEKVRLTAAAAITFYPHMVSNVRFIYTESSSLFLIVLGVFLYVFQKYPASGFFGYLSYTFRPSLFLVIPFMIIYDFFRKKNKPALKTAAGFVTGILLFTSMEWSGVTAPSANQYYNILVSVSGSGYDLDFKLKNFSEAEQKHPLKTYFNFIVNHPVEYAEQRVLSLWSLWGPLVPPTKNSGIAGMILHGLRFPVFVLALAAFLFRKKMKYSIELIWLLSFPIISVTLIHFLTFSSQRHHFTAEPFAIVLGILLLDYLFKFSESSKKIVPDVRIM
jgi:hypothetical protein